MIGAVAAWHESIVFLIIYEVFYLMATVHLAIRCLFRTKLLFALPLAIFMNVVIVRFIGDVYSNVDTEQEEKEPDVYKRKEDFEKGENIVNEVV